MENGDDQLRSDGNQKVQIPITLPGILKEYTKAVLRTQPEDVLGWSANYFGEVSRQPQLCSLSQDQDKQDLQNAIQERLRSLYTDNKGILIDLSGCKALYAEFSDTCRIPVDALRINWLSKNYSSVQLRELLALGRMYKTSLDRDCFCAMICGTLGSTLRETLRLFVEVASGADDVDSQKIPFAKFNKICKFLLELNNDEGSDAAMDLALSYFRTLSASQKGMVTAKNVMDAQIEKMDD